MRLHTNGAWGTSGGILAIVGGIPGVDVARLSEHKSRTHARGIEIILRGSGLTGGQWGSYDDKTATWDEWGIFLAECYRRDEHMRVGGRTAPVYANRAHFRWATGNRYDTLSVRDQHLRHRWEHNGESLTGCYSVQECQCGAVRRFAQIFYVRDLFPMASPEVGASLSASARLATLRRDVAELRAEIIGQATLPADLDPEYPYDRGAERKLLADVDEHDRYILAMAGARP